MREGTIYINHPKDGLVAIGPDDEIPSWARKQIDKRHLKASDSDSDSDSDGGDSGDEPYNPSDHTVDEVNDYLSGDDVDEDEVARVLAAEGADEGKQRAGILNGPHAAA